MKNTKKLSCRFYLGLTVLLLFFLGIQDAAQEKIKLFQYFDEIFGLFFFPLFVLRIVQKKLSLKFSRSQILIVGLLALFWCSGWAGVFRYHYQPMENVLKDSYVALKFFLALAASYLLFLEFGEFVWMEKRLWHFLNAATVILFVLCILDMMFGLFYTERRYGLPAIKLFYDSYTALVAVCCVLCAFYLRMYEYYREKIIVPIAMLFFVMLNTRRVKALGAMAGLFLIYIYAFHRKKKVSKKVLAVSSVCLGIAFVSIVWQTVYYFYQLGSESARLIMMIAAPYITKDYLPFGTGWATFGSAFSGEPYSPVYTKYGMNVVWGISPGHHQFISDTFWPMILVESGVVGLAAYIGVLVLLMKKIQKLKQYNRSAFASAAFAMIYLLLSSMSESAFVNPLAVPFAFLIGFLFAEQNSKERRVGESV